MTRKLAGLLGLFACVGLFLVFVSDRIGDRARVAEQGRTVLLPLAPLGLRGLSHGDRIELVYALPEIDAELQAGDRPGEGMVAVTLDPTGIVRSARLHEGGPPAESEILLRYRFAPVGPGLLPSDRPRLSFGDSFFLVTAGRVADYLDARYAVLRVDPQGASVVVGMANDEAVTISPEP